MWYLTEAARAVTGPAAFRRRPGFLADWGGKTETDRAAKSCDRGGKVLFYGMANKLDTLEDLDAPSRPEWRKWLAAHHTQPEGVWLILYKKESGQRQMAYADAVEEALCFGWIDSLPRKIDAARYKLLFSPRKKGSVWSALNKRRVAQLEAAGLLMPTGRAKIEAAQQDGSWNLLNSSDALEMPADLGQALADNAVAQQNFAAFSESSRKQILQYVANAKRPETRQKRIAQTVELAAQNQKPNQ